MSLDFESLSDFTLVFNPWTVVDVKGGNTYGIQGISFTNNYLPMAYICFNPSKTNPALINMQAHSGQRLGCCFSTIPSTPPAPAVTPNDKWLISPRMSLGINPQIEFWVKTYNAEFGLERYNMAVSTAGLQPSDFMPLTILPEEAPVNWTKKNYGLQDYAGQDVYIGIQCITDNGFIFMIDDISITSTVGTGDKDASEQLVIFPNPASDQINLKFTAFRMEKLNIKLYDVVGTEIMSWDEVSPAGIISLAIPKVIQGVYVMKIMYGTNEIIRKISVIN
jgi:hypothetical protein